LRGYAGRSDQAQGGRPRSQQRPEPPPSEWSVTYDTETFTDHAQQVRIIPYQVRRGETLHEAGVAFDPVSLTDAERSLLYAYCAHHGLMARTVDEFVEEVFFEVVFWRRGTCVG